MTTTSDLSAISSITNANSQASSTNAASSTSATQKVHHHRHHGQAGAAQQTESDPSGVSNQVSKPAEFLNKLQQLKDQDPEKFKTVVSGIADKLKSAAQAQGDSTAAQRLNALADKFQSVAQSGDLSQLKPPQGSLGTRPPREAYAATNAQTQPSLATDSASSSSASNVHQILQNIFSQI